MNPRERQETVLEDVLYEFAIAQDRPDAGLLSEFIRRFPQHADVLTEFAVSLALETFSDIPPEESGQELSARDNAAISRAMSRFQNRIYEIDHEPQTKTAPHDAGNPFHGLTVADLDELAKRIHANRTFVVKLRDSQIATDTMTMGFKRKVAEELHAPLDLVVAHFARPQQIRSNLRLKAAGKPKARPKQSFTVAVRNSGLTPDQQAWLIAL
jgi:hypothetical protein